MTDLTRTFGLVSYGLAGAVCLVAAWRRPGPGRLFWGALAFLHLFLAAEVELKLRFDLKSMVRDMIRGTAMGKEALQAAGLAAGGLVVLVLAVWTARKAGGPEPRFALVASFVSVGLFVLETVSIHQVADVIYDHIGPAALIGWLWVIAAAPVTLLAARGVRG